MTGYSADRQALEFDIAELRRVLGRCDLYADDRMATRLRKRATQMLQDRYRQRQAMSSRDSLNA